MAPTILLSKFAGTCRRCQRKFPAGTRVEWARGVGASHADLAECAAAAQQPPPEATFMDGRAIADFLKAAGGRGLKQPKARFLAPGGGELVLSLAGPRSKAPGSVQVYIRTEWVGRIEPDGRVVGNTLCNLPVALAAIATIAIDPVDAAKQYGALTCKCSFCGLPLSDEGSVEVGYGPICAKRWGLPWVRKGTPSVHQVAV